jgi:uncharacterized membrane protein
MLSADTSMLISHAFLLVGLLVGTPLVTAAIVRATLKGKPHNFGRDMYGIVFVVTCAGFLFLGTYAQRMSADVRTWQYVLQTVLMGLVELLFGVAAGCMISVFVYKRGLSSQKSE